MGQLLLLALFHGLLYAFLLPPWGLIDEPQHVHYIQSLAEVGVAPVAGRTLLSPAIIDSLFETERWETFHWTTPPSRSPQDLGAIAHSYEAYQPPLFYVLLAPIYAVIPPDILNKVFILRGVVVFLSLITLAVTWKTARLLAPNIRWLPVIAVLFLISLPERTFAVSRINNDMLVEILAAIYIYQWTVIVLDKVTPSRSLRLALLLALGVYTKFSMIFLLLPMLLLGWYVRHSRRQVYWCALAVIVTLLLIMPLVLRNLWLYDSVTGIAIFDSLYQIEPPAMTWMSVADALFALFAHTWVIWWKGSNPAVNPVIILTATVMALVVLTSLATLVRHAQVQSSQHVWSPRTFVVAVYIATLLLYGLSILFVYFRGMVPVLQGRFLLPVSVPLAIVVTYGLRSGPLGAYLALFTAIFLLAVDALSLFGNLLPYFYYWSGIVAGELVRLRDGIAWPLALPLLYQRFAADKPNWLAPVAPWLVVTYLLVVASTLRSVWRFAMSQLQPAHFVQVRQEIA